MQPNKRLQQTGAQLAEFRVSLGSNALLRNERLSYSFNAPAAEAHVR
jgi:hypothetical protein